MSTEDSIARGCRGKVRFVTRAEARFARQDMQNKKGGAFDVYSCMFCEYFHIGHRKSRKDIKTLKALDKPMGSRVT